MATYQFQSLRVGSTGGIGSEITTVSLASIGSQWLNHPNGIHYSSGFVGIGTDTPTVELHVVGSIC